MTVIGHPTDQQFTKKEVEQVILHTAVEVIIRRHPQPAEMKVGLEEAEVFKTDSKNMLLLPVLLWTGVLFKIIVMEEDPEEVVAEVEAVVVGVEVVDDVP